MTRTSSILSFFLAFLLVTAGCDLFEDTQEDLYYQFDFAGDMQAWEAQAVDVENPGDDPDQPEVPWHVEHTTEESYIGEASVELHVFNKNDASKIWMERPISAAPGTEYEVTVQYAFGTSDWGDVNHWTIIAGVHNTPPRSADELEFQGDTANNSDEDTGIVWLDKEYTFTRTADDEGQFHVALGVWGTSEFTRTYYIDHVRINLEAQ